MCWYFLTFIERIHKHTKLLLLLSLESIQGIIFSIGNRGTLLANSSEDNIEVELERAEMDFYGLGSKDR